MKTLLMLLAAVLCLAGTAQASYPTWADLGQMADCGTTYYGIENGYAEANPLFSGAHPGLICAAKLAVSQASKYTPKVMCETSQVVLAIAGFGAAIWNVAVMLGSGLYGIPVIAAMLYFGFDPFVEESKKTCGRDI